MYKPLEQHSSKHFIVGKPFRTKKDSVDFARLSRRRSQDQQGDQAIRRSPRLYLIVVIKP